MSAARWVASVDRHASLVSGHLELVGGALFAVGFLTRPVAFILAGDMAVAYFMAHAPKAFFPVLNGGDGAILYCFIFLIYVVAGPGRWAADGPGKRS